MQTTVPVKADQEVPLVRAAFAEPFRIAMRSNGIDADAWFRKVRLPVAKLADPASLLPLKPFYRLINQVAIAENIPDFGMQVAQARRWFEIETMKPRLEIQPNLRLLLREFCRMAAGQSSIVSFVFKVEHDNCRFVYQNKPLATQDIQMELYRTTSMIELVQVFTGGDWRPRRVELMMADNRSARSNAILQDCELAFASPVTAIHFPAILLETSRGRGKPIRFNREVAAREFKTLVDKTGLIPALEQILDSYVVETDLSIELIADIVGISPRGLQRRVQAQGSSYRRLLNAARKRYALSHLHIERMGIGKISKRLGYSDVSHFTRAFKSWTGLSPSAYRLKVN